MSDKLKKIKVGVYQLTPVSSKIGKFKEVGYVKYGKNFDDEIINITKESYPESMFDINNNRVKYNDDIYLQFYKDNLPSTYIANTTRIPVFHCAVMYSQTLLVGNLFNIYLYFNVAEAKSIRSFNQLIDTNLKGTYSLMIEFNDKSDELPIDDFVSIHDTISNIIEMFSSDLLKEIIDNEMAKRLEERIKRYGKPDDYVIPNKIIKFDDIIKKYKESNGDMNQIMEMYNK